MSPRDIATGALLARASFMEVSTARLPAPVAPAAPRGFRKRVMARMSLVLFIVMHLACAFVIVYPPTWPLVGLALASYLLRMWGITAGYHRYFAHRSFRTSRVFQFVLALIGSTAMENGPLWWASWHRRHHKYVDTPADPHSPLVYGFWQAHVGWIFDPRYDWTDLSNVRDLSRFRELRLLDRYAWVPLVGYALLCYAIAGAAGVVWGFVVSTIAVNHATFCINSLAHMWGSRRYRTPDTSRNNPLLALIALGEGWHNNHHFYMSSARQGFFWWEVDVSYYTLKLLAWLRLIHDVHQPPAWVRSGQSRASQPDSRSMFDVPAVTGDAASRSRSGKSAVRGVAHGLGEQDAFAFAQAKPLLQRATVDPGTEDADEPSTGGVKVHVLGHRARARGREQQLLLFRPGRHVTVVGDIDQVDGRVVHEVLIAGHAPGVDLGYQPERVRLGVVDVDALGERHIDVDLLGVQRRGRGTTASFCSVDTARRPQQVGKHVLGQCGGRKLAL